MARVVEPQLGRLAGSPVMLSFDRLFASDIAGRARAFQSMVKSGLSLDQAARVSGILQGDEPVRPVTSTRPTTGRTTCRITGVSYVSHQDSRRGLPSIRGDLQLV